MVAEHELVEIDEQVALTQWTAISKVMSLRDFEYSVTEADCVVGVVGSA